MLNFYIMFAVCLATYTINADEIVLGNDGKRQDLNKESKERGIMPNKPNNKRRKGNFTTIPQENNVNGNYGTQNLNVDLSDGGLMINGKKVTRAPGKRVNFNGDNVLHSSKSNTSNFTTYNNSNNTGHAVYNQGGVSVSFKGDALVINGKKVPGIKANEAAVIEYDKGVLKVNGVRKAIFDGIQGSGSIILGSNSNIDYNEDFNEDEDSWMDQGNYQSFNPLQPTGWNNGYVPKWQNNNDLKNQEDTKRLYRNQRMKPNQIHSIPAEFNNGSNKSRKNTKKPQYQNNNFMMDTYRNINTGNNISHIGGVSYGNNYKGRKRPGNALRMGNLTMNSNGMKMGGPNGLQMGPNGMKLGGPNGLEMGPNGMKFGGPHGLEMGPNGMKIGKRKENGGIRIG